MKESKRKASARLSPVTEKGGKGELQQKGIKTDRARNHKKLSRRNDRTR